MGIVLVSWFWLGHLYYLVKCLCDIQALCHYVILSSAHCVQIVSCHLHIVCKLCVSFLSMSLFVSVIICHVNMLYSHCMLCHYVQCHMTIVMLWSISCGLFYERVKTVLVLWSGHLRFSATYLRLSLHFWSMCGLGCLHFSSENVNSCVWGYESLSRQNVKMSKCPLWS